MLHSAKTLNGYKLDSLDGEMGKVEGFYFDDKHWVLRYLVARFWQLAHRTTCAAIPVRGWAP